MAFHSLRNLAACLVALAALVRCAAAQTYYGEDAAFLQGTYGAGFPHALVMCYPSSPARPGWWVLGAWAVVPEGGSLKQPSWYVKMGSSPGGGSIVVPLKMSGGVWKGSFRVANLVSAPNVSGGGAVLAEGAWEAFDCQLELTGTNCKFITTTGEHNIARPLNVKESYTSSTSASSVPYGSYHSASELSGVGPLDGWDGVSTVSRGYVKAYGVAFDYLGKATSATGTGSTDPVTQAGIGADGELPVTGQDMLTRFYAKADIDDPKAALHKKFMPPSGLGVGDAGTELSSVLNYLHNALPPSGEGWVRPMIDAALEKYVSMFLQSNGLFATGASSTMAWVKSVVSVFVVLLTCFAGYYEVVWGCGLRNPRALNFDMRQDDD